jgi:hypothetical protein
MSAVHSNPTDERPIGALIPAELPSRSPPQPLVLPPLPATELPGDTDPASLLLDTAGA